MGDPLAKDERSWDDSTLWAYCEVKSKGKKACLACHVRSKQDVGISYGPRTYDAILLGRGVEDGHDDGVHLGCTKRMSSAVTPRRSEDVPYH
ncbi:UNVERIFIED_CONTAM: hypothetical protein Sindi_2022700 [Sesamum indicum]